MWEYNMTSERMYQILDICSSIEEVKKDVIKNHDNNLWWPLDVKDYRKRLLIGGLSTRVSYSMISHYREVVKKIDEYEYESIIQLSDDELISILRPLGLSNNRLKYIKSMINLINKYNDKLLKYENDELIELIAKNVNGASYKVAQCCVLYMRDYHCGIMPVDSGMKDMAIPCIGLGEFKDGIGHEYARKELETIINKVDLKKLIIKNGYDNLKFPINGLYNWWAHLVLIYYKRHIATKETYLVAL